MYTKYPNVGGRSQPDPYGAFFTRGQVQRGAPPGPPPPQYYGAGYHGYGAPPPPAANYYNHLPPPPPQRRPLQMQRGPGQMGRNKMPNKGMQQNGAAKRPKLGSVQKGAVSGITKKAAALTVDSEKKEKEKLMNNEKIRSLRNEGLVLKSAPDMFWCVFCDANVTSIKGADDHVVSELHKNSRKDGFGGITQLDRVFLVQSPRMADASIAIARREALETIFGNQKLEFVNEGIRLKDGRGCEAYWCAPCGIHLPSVSLVNEHIKNRRHTDAVGKKEDSEESEDKKINIRSLEDHLKTNTQPIIGLESIIEFADPDGEVQRVYQCSLCNTMDVENSIIAHLVSYEHRLNFIKTKDEKEAEKFSKQTKENEKLIEKKVEELLAERVEDEVKWETRMEKSTIVEDAKRQVISLPPPDSAKSAGGGDSTGGTGPIKILKAKPTMAAATLLEHLNNFSIETDSQLDEVARIISKLTDSIMLYKAGDNEPLRDVISQKHLIGQAYGRILSRIDRVVADEATVVAAAEAEKAAAAAAEKAKNADAEMAVDSNGDVKANVDEDMAELEKLCEEGKDGPAVEDDSTADTETTEPNS